MVPNTAVNSPRGEGPERSEAYFSSPELAQRTDLLRHLTENSNLIPLVRGVEGIGKSTFIKHLLDLAPGNWIPAEIAADVMLQPEALLAKLAGLYDLDAASNQLMESLTLRFDDLRQDGFLPVIIVDDAHLLPEATVITLLRLHESGPNENPLAQILLFAQPEIDGLLNTPQLKVMNLQSLQLLDMPLFSKEQTRRFLEHLLASGQSILNRPLSQAQIEKVYRESSGMPGLIKQQAARLFESGEKGKARFDFAEFVSIRAVIGGGLVLIVVLLGLVYQDSINNMFSGDKKLSEVGQDVPVMSGKTQQLALPEFSSVEPGFVPEQTTNSISGPDDSGNNSVDTREGSDMERSVVALPGAEQTQATTAPGDEAPEEQPVSTPDSGEYDEPAEEITAPPAETAAAPGLDEVPEPDPVRQQGPEQKQTPPVKESVEKDVVMQLGATATGYQASEPVAQPGITVETEPGKPAKTTARLEKSPAAQQVSSKEVPVKSKLKAPKITKPALPVTANKVPVEPKTQKSLSKSRVKTRIPAVPPEKKRPGSPAPVVQVKKSYRGLAQESPPTPAPIEERSTLLVKKEVPAVKLSSAPEAKPHKSPVYSGKKPAKRPQAGSPGTLREDWLLKQKPSSYTIQLVGLQEEKGVKIFMRRHPLTGPVAYYRTKRNEKQWFPVLYGVFPNRERALQARDGLPENLRKSGAWLRTLGSVQKDIRAR